MTGNKIRLENRDGKMVGIDPETDEIVPIELGETNLESLNTEEATINERNLTLGKDTSSNREDTTVLGGGAEYDAEEVDDSNEDQAVVIGTDAYADTGWSVTIGAGAESLYDEDDEGDSTVAIGRRATAKGHSNVAIGRHAEATETYRATAIGRGAHASGAHSIALGYHWEDDHQGATSGGTIAIGRASATSSAAIAIGEDSEATETGGIAIGRDAVSEGDFRGVAIGEGAQTTDGWSVAIGPQAQANDREGVAIGRGAKTDGGDQSIAIGNDAEADGWRSIALGKGAYTDENGEMIIRLNENNVFKMNDNGDIEIAGELTENVDL